MAAIQDVRTVGEREAGGGVKRSPFRRRPGAKYNARKVLFQDYGTFDSKRELEHFQSLLLREKAGEIRDIQRQVLLRLEVNGKLVCKWKPDFIYQRVADGKLVIDETKGFRTRDFMIKWKLAQALMGEDYEFVLS